MTDSETDSGISRRKLLEYGVKIGGVAAGLWGARFLSNLAGGETAADILNPGKRMATVVEFSPRAPQDTLPIIARHNINESDYFEGREWKRIIADGNEVRSIDGKLIFDGCNFLPGRPYEVRAATLSPKGWLLKVDYTEREYPPYHQIVDTGLGGEVKVENKLPRVLNKKQKSGVIVVERPKDADDKKNPIRYLDFDSGKDTIFFDSEDNVIVLQPSPEHGGDIIGNEWIADKKKYPPNCHYGDRYTYGVISVWRMEDHSGEKRLSKTPLRVNTSDLTGISEQEDKLIKRITSKDGAKVQYARSELRIGDDRELGLAVTTPDGKYIAVPAIEERVTDDKHTYLRDVIVFDTRSGEFKRITAYDFPGGSPDTNSVAVVGSYRGNILVRRDVIDRGRRNLAEVGVYGIGDGILAPIKTPKGAYGLIQTQYGIEVRVGAGDGNEPIVYRFPNEKIFDVKTGIIKVENTIEHWSKLD